MECLESVVDPKGSGTNRHRYVVASQDAEVRAKMRSIAGVPLIYISRSVMILEPMAAATKDVKAKEERGKVRAGLKGGRASGENSVKRKREEDDDGAGRSAVDEKQAPPKKRKAKGPKEPNPLSVKKAKKENKSATATATREVDEERAAVKKSLKKDPQAAEKAVGPAHAVQNGESDDITDSARKRKRKRKPKETSGPKSAADVGDVDV